MSFVSSTSSKLFLNCLFLWWYSHRMWWFHLFTNLKQPKYLSRKPQLKMSRDNLIFFAYWKMILNCKVNGKHFIWIHPDVKVTSPGNKIHSFRGQVHLSTHPRTLTPMNSTVLLSPTGSRWNKKIYFVTT